MFHSKIKIGNILTKDDITIKSYNQHLKNEAQKEYEEHYKKSDNIQDNIKNPSHYTKGKIEVWDFIIDQQLGYCAGNAIKYICRAKHKGKEKEDLMKAKEYIEKLIKGLEGKE